MIVVLVLFFAFLLLFYAIGSAVPPAVADRRERTVFSLVLGIGISVMFFQLLTLHDVFRRPAAGFAWVGAGLLAGFISIRRDPFVFRRPWRFDWRDDGPIFALQTVSFVHAASPPMDGDSLSTYLVVPGHWVADGGLFARADSVFSGLTGPALNLNALGLLWADGRLSQLLSAFLAGTVCLYLAAFIERRFFNHRGPALAPLALWCAPVFGYLSASAKTDLVSLMFELAAVASVMSFAASSDEDHPFRWAALAIAFGSLAAATKVLGYAFFLSLLAILIIVPPATGRWKRMADICAAAPLAVGAFLLWFVPSRILYGSFFAPLDTASRWGVPMPSAASMAGLAPTADVGTMLEALWLITFDAHYDGIGLLWLALIPFGIAWAVKQKPRVWLIVFWAGSGLLAFSAIRSAARDALWSSVVVVAASAAGLNALPGTPFRRLASAVVVGLAFFLGFAQSARAIVSLKKMPAVFFGQAPAEYAARNLHLNGWFPDGPVVGAFNAAPEPKRLIGLPLNSYYFAGRANPDGRLDGLSRRRLSEFQSADALQEFFRQTKVTHVAIHNRWLKDPPASLGPLADPEVRKRLMAIVAAGENFTLFAVTAAGKERDEQ